MGPVDEAPDIEAHEEFRDAIQKLSAKFREMVSVYDMAHAPLVLGAYGRFQRAITNHGSFDARTRVAIALVVANTLVVANNCADCLFPHTVGCHAAGWTPTQINTLHTGTRIVHEEKITALLAVARQVAGDPGDVDEDTWRHALQTGWTIDELAELLTHVFANILTNYLDHYPHESAALPTEIHPVIPDVHIVRCGDVPGRVEAWLRISGTSGRTA
ncbi:MAG: carboxymuconolactone decarboxylase family protein [Pseudonocardiaceae bacterium]